MNFKTLGKFLLKKASLFVITFLVVISAVTFAGIMQNLNLAKPVQGQPIETLR